MPFRSRISLASAVTSSSFQPGVDSSKHTPNDILDDPTAAQTSFPPDDTLPPPVQASAYTAPERRKPKRTRISLGLHIRWERFLRKLGTGTAPSTSSAFDDSTGDSTTAYGQSLQERKLRVPAEEDAEVDEVVVDREWTADLKSSVHSEHEGSPEKSREGTHPAGYGAGTNTDRDSLAVHADGFWVKWMPLLYLRYRLWPVIYAFFATHFMDEKSESHYRKESWFLRKSLALWSAAFYVLNWALAVGFIPHPADLSDKIFYYGYMPVFTFPLFFLVAYDFPRDRPFFYQTYLAFATWSWSVYQILFMFLCGFYDSANSHFDCEGKDFLLTFYYTGALQTIALFGLGLNRFPASLGSIVFLALAFGMIIPDKTSFVRNLINVMCFQVFLLYVHYMRENAERRLYTLRDQLKIQFRETQRAQMNERKAADSKRRLTSYVFHEVRVPLNTALLAVQNMEASGTIAKTQEIEFRALEGSLSMMSKVLNDVLDFNRMDSGRFESVLKPYAFHQVMRSLFVPLRFATDARDLEFVHELDGNVDRVARYALLEAQGMSAEEIGRVLVERPDDDGYVVGDETRLRQIITNLASNACKFTPAGGKLMIKTRLVVPMRPPLTPESDGEKDTPPLDEKSARGLSSKLLSQHDGLYTKTTPLERIIVRIEVTDTGCGIRPKDMVQSKLFSAFNQTEMGRQQGGKGTGLGLALVRQIVKRSGGRLGVRSKANEGSTFWVELPLGVGHNVLAGMTSVNGSLRRLEPNMFARDERNVPMLPDSEKPTPPASPLPYVQEIPRESALQHIMEQGGLVELSTRRDQETRVLTRTIGDPSTGTEPVRHDPSFSSASSSPSQTPQERSPEIPLSFPQFSPKIPPRLELPKPRDFATESPVGATNLPSPSPSPHDNTNTNGSGPSTSPISPTTLSPASPQSDPERFKGLRVLVVDDDNLTRKLMSRMLTRLGCKVSTAENGEIALDMILNAGQRPTPSSEDTGSGGLGHAHHHHHGNGNGNEERSYNVIFLDNQMPVLSGLEAVERLRKLGRRDLVVGVTGNALLSDQEEYLAAGVDHVLTKPVLEKSLKSMLCIADDRRRASVACLVDGHDNSQS